MESFNLNRHLKEQFVSNLTGSSKLEIFFLITNLSMLLTCFSILAVDFKIFPRRYAKTEAYGTSLMDLGVGSFVVANSLVSRQARGVSNMFMLGNIHWNFFFTLAAVAILTSIINVHPKYCGILGSFILIGYQALLLSGLNKYLLSEERGTDIFSQNKEGIFSIFGEDLFTNLVVSQKTKKWTRTRVWALCLLFWSITLLVDWQVEPISRRMANILTGLVNLSVDTLSVSSTSALAILFTYAFVLSFAVGLAGFLGIKFKFW
ncbi:UNVERIFIED_CONTAM: hypothetical protein Slati_0241000 [Sesamum latifolium]|uniref:Uncharacterized protein n=1 Tax=Sesamum latifolium TaxID=2727402 RepID=A0AAW2YCR5_9LAMI